MPVTRTGGEDRMGSSLTEPPGLLDTGQWLRGQHRVSQTQGSRDESRAEESADHDGLSRRRWRRGPFYVIFNTLRV